MSAQRRSTRPVAQHLVVVAALMVGGLAALVSSIVTMAVVWLSLDGQAAWTKGLVVLVGTVLGAVVGGWWSQPLVARLLDRG